MFNSQLNNKKKPQTSLNNLETLKNYFNGKTTSKEFIGRDFSEFEEKEKKPQKKQLVNLFNYQQYYEKELIKRQIKELTELIKKEIEEIKQTNKTLLTEVKDVANLAINEQGEKPGIYHVRFFELVLNLLRQLRVKISESKTWLEALLTKKKKRGSLFALRSKKLGTQYSLSQELHSSRSVQ